MSPIVNLQLVVKCKKRSFHSFKVEVALLRYIVFYCELGCDTSEPHVSYISRACSSLVRQPYYIPNRFILKISVFVVVLTVRKVHWAGGTFYMDEYTLIFLFSQCMRCAQKRYCWESVRFASERSRVRIPLGPPICRIVLYDAAFFMSNAGSAYAHYRFSLLCDTNVRQHFYLPITQPASIERCNGDGGEQFARTSVQLKQCFVLSAHPHCSLGLGICIAHWL